MVRTCREEVVDVFRKGQFKFLVFNETKLRGNWEVSWCGVNVIITGVQEIERSLIFMNEMWHSAVTDFGSVSSRTLWINFKFSRVTVCAEGVYGPTKQDSEERERF